MPAPSDPIKRQQWVERLSAAGRGNTNGSRTVTDAERAAMSLRSKACCTPEECERRRQRALAQGFGKSNKGRRLSPKHKEAMAAALRGKTYEQIYGSGAAKQKLVRKISNKKTYAPRIKLDKATRNKHNADAEYKHWRTAVFRRDGYTCRHCQTRGGTLHAHHIKSWADFPKQRYLVKNGLTLCVSCHNKHHMRRTAFAINKLPEVIPYANE